MAPKLSKIKLKGVCFQCGYFNPEMGAKRYKCAGSKCPGVHWSNSTKEAVMLTYHLRTDRGGKK